MAQASDASSGSWSPNIVKSTLDVAPSLGHNARPVWEDEMASKTQQTQKIRKHKHRTAGANRKAEIRRDHRLQSEKVLEAALGEHFTLDTVRK